MPTNILNGSEPGHLPAAQLTLTARLHGGGALRLTVRPSVPGLVSRPGRLVFPGSIWRPESVASRNAEPLTVSVAPEGDATFPAGSVLHLELISSGTGTATADDDRLTVSRVDVAGERFRDVIELAPGLHGVAVRAIQPEQVEELTELGSAALVAARRLFGNNGLPTTRRRPVGILVDGSASMGAALECGVVRAIVDVIVGICPLVATGPPQVGILAGSMTIRVPPTSGALLAAATEDVLRQVVPGTGIPCISVADGDGAVTFLVTDTVPYDQPSGVHAVLAVPDSAHRVLARQSARSDTPMTFVGTAPTGATGDDTFGELRLPDLVGSLLQAWTTRRANGR